MFYSDGPSRRRSGLSSRPYCTTVCVPGRRPLRSTERGFLIVHFPRTTKQKRAFSVVGPSLWNGKSLALRLFPIGFALIHFPLIQKLPILAILESRALLSGHLEVAL